MPQAIETKYLPAENVRGSRIKATCERGSITIDYPHQFNTDNAHRFAAKCLIAKFCTEDATKGEERYRTPIAENPWNRPFVTGGLPKRGYCHVYIDGVKRGELAESIAEVFKIADVATVDITDQQDRDQVRGDISRARDQWSLFGRLPLNADGTPDTTETI